jgi:hypothetical protein
VKVEIEFESDDEVVTKSFDMIRALIDEFADKDPRVAELAKSIPAHLTGIPPGIGSRGWGGATIGISRVMNMPATPAAPQEVQTDTREALEERDYVPIEPQRKDVRSDYTVVTDPTQTNVATYTDVDVSVPDATTATAFKDYLLTFHLRRFK